MWSRGQVKNLSKEVIESGLVENAKPIYWHTISFTRGGTATSGLSRLFGNMVIINQSEDAITTDSFMDLLKIDGFYGVVINGKHSSTPADGWGSMENNLTGIKYYSSTQFRAIVRDASTNAESQINNNLTGFEVTDLGVNKLN